MPQRQDAREQRRKTRGAHEFDDLHQHRQHHGAEQRASQVLGLQDAPHARVDAGLGGGGNGQRNAPAETPEVLEVECARQQAMAAMMISEVRESPISRNRLSQAAMNTK